MDEQMVLFTLGQEEYGLPIGKVKEIVPYRGATKLPQTPAYMDGIIELRGTIIPVIDLAQKLGLQTTEAVPRIGMIVEAPEGEVGILVDAVTEVAYLTAAQIEAAPAMLEAHDYIQGIGKAGERLIVLLDLQQLFTVADDEMSEP